MSSIAPNGTLISDYDADGLGAIAMLGTFRSEYSTSIEFGEEIEAATASLRPASVIDFAADSTVSTGVVATDAVVVGTWKCLGKLPLSDVNISRAASLFMRVA